MQYQPAGLPLAVVCSTVLYLPQIATIIFLFRIGAIPFPVPHIFIFSIHRHIAKRVSINVTPISHTAAKCTHSPLPRQRATQPRDAPHLRRYPATITTTVARTQRGTPHHGRHPSPHHHRRATTPSP